MKKIYKLLSFFVLIAVFHTNLFATTSEKATPVLSGVFKFGDAEKEVTNKTKKIFMILWLGNGLTPTDKAFVDYFKDKKYDLLIEYEDAMQDKEKIKTIVEKIRKQKPDLVYVYGTPPSLEILGKLDGSTPKTNIIDDIPIVAYIINPVSAGMLKEFGPTDKNWTGVSILVPPSAQVETIKKYGDFKKIAAVFAPTETNAVVSLKQFKEYAVKEGYTIEEFPFPVVNGKADPTQIKDTIEKAAASKPDLIFLPPDGFTSKYIADVSKYIQEQKLPSFTTMEFGILAPNSTLFGVVASSPVAGQVGAYQAEQILFENVPVSKIPFQTVPKLSFVTRVDTLSNIKRYPNLDFVEITRFVK